MSMPNQQYTRWHIVLLRFVLYFFFWNNFLIILNSNLGGVIVILMIHEERWISTFMMMSKQYSFFSFPLQRLVAWFCLMCQKVLHWGWSNALYLHSFFNHNFIIFFPCVCVRVHVLLSRLHFNVLCLQLSSVSTQLIELRIYLLYAGCFSCYSWRYRLPNIFPRLWQHSWAGYYLSPWWLFLSYLLWYNGETIVCITSAILVQIYLIGIFMYFVLKHFLLYIQMSSDLEASKHVEKICSAWLKPSPILLSYKMPMIENLLLLLPMDTWMNELFSLIT